MLILYCMLEIAFVFINEHLIFQDKIFHQLLFSCCYLMNMTTLSCRKG